MIALLRRPLVQLPLMSALLFVVYATLVPRFDNVITITAADAAAAANMRQDLIGRELTAEERDAAVEIMIEDEMLVREAYRRGIDRGDPRVRTFLTDAMYRTLVDPAATDTAPPTISQLRDYYETHRERYQVPETITFDQVFYPFGALAPEDETAVIDALRSGANPRALVVGVGFAASGIVRAASRPEVSRAAGREFANELFSLDPGSWQGPLRANQGIVFGRVLERQPARARSFEEVQQFVEQDWYRARQDTVLQAELQRVRRRYDVQVAGGGGGR